MSFEDASDLIGAWRLESAVEVFDDGERRDEFGPEVDGYLCYSPDGIVSATLGSAGRPSVSADDPQSAAAAEYEAMAKLFIAYAGRYTVDLDAGTVTHHVDVALFPNWEGEGQVRRVSIEGSRLDIVASDRTGADGRTFHSEIAWTRVSDNERQRTVPDGL